MERQKIPLFPLHAVVFPGGPLALKVFEARYLDMIGRCLRQDSPFGICLIDEGDEVGSAATTFEVGTVVRIHYWNRRADGVLGITVRGERRFRLLSREVQVDQLVVAEVELLAEDVAKPIPPEYGGLVRLLREILESLGHPYVTLPRNYGDAGWVSARLAELLPITLAQKQYLLQIDDPLKRLERLRGMVENGRIA